MIYLIEGVNGVGKSTLIEQLPLKSYKFGLSKDELQLSIFEMIEIMEKRFKEVLDKVKGDVIFDRSWFSTAVYQSYQAYHSDLSSEEYQNIILSLKELVDTFMKLNNYIIVHLTDDIDKIYKRLHNRGAKDNFCSLEILKELEDLYWKIYRPYSPLISGNYKEVLKLLKKIL